MTTKPDTNATAGGGTGERIDVISLLLQQHDLIRDLFEQVELATPSTREQAFEPLVRLLAVHETAEEMVVHPALRTCGAEGDTVADARSAEEDQATTMLAGLEGMDPASLDFMVAFEELRSAVLRHAELEEREEFPILVRTKDIDDLQRMATRVNVAEAVAPTHAHAAAPESALGNVLTGPFLSIVDRVRDLIRDATR